MKFDTMYWISFIGWGVGLTLLGAYEAAIVVIFLHVVYRKLHLVELKINRLMDQHNLYYETEN